MYKPADLPNFPKLDSQKARKQFVRLLQDAHAGELAAAYAYTGHGYSFFVRDSAEKKEILEIRDEELHHRQRLKEMLIELGEKPRLSRELLMSCIGLTIGFLCLFGGWFIPMYGAGKLESGNIFEYEVAARLAVQADCERWVSELLEFGEIEWDHELYFRGKAQTHFMYKIFPKWTIPDQKSFIRDNYTNWLAQL